MVRKSVILFFLGLCSAIPFAATLGLLQAWVGELGISLTAIGFFSLTRMPYSLKFLWAPLFDHYAPPFGSRRRGWLMVCALALAGGIWLLAAQQSGEAIALGSLLVCFLGASFDIVLDAYRRDVCTDKDIGAATSAKVAGWRVGFSLFAGALALFLADHISWFSVYAILAGTILVAVPVIYWAPAELEVENTAPPAQLRDSFVLPLKQMLQKENIAIILLFVMFYKLGDNLASAMTIPFFRELGFTKTDIATAQKLYGFAAVILGGFFGAAVMARVSLNRCLWIFGLLQAIPQLGFALLAVIEPSTLNLRLVICIDNFFIGSATTAYSSYLALLCSRQFSGTQYALLTSLMSLAPILLSSFTGAAASFLGWPAYFVLCTCFALPGMVLLLFVAPWRGATR